MSSVPFSIVNSSYSRETAVWTSLCTFYYLRNIAQFGNPPLLSAFVTNIYGSALAALGRT